ncbi:MAG: Gldg family protein [Acidobacteria bacterium]|nr:Gldg family protein [Acidobacteriota bacterium]MDA1234977.1 Gldg family protein [Acidobacteriota bacterium]
MANWFRSKQARAGSYSATYVVVFIAILAAMNYLAVEYNKTFDATEQKLYSLSDQTIRVLDGLESDVKIYYFDQQFQLAGAKNSLVRYENASNRVTVQYVDPDAEPAVTRAMNVRTLGSTIVEVGVSRSEAPSTSEEDITNTIIKAIKGEVKEACFLTGHGEATLEDQDRMGISLLAGEATGANYSTRTVSLLENPQIPASCSVVVVAGPSTAYLDPEVHILRQYAGDGGRLLFMLDYDANSGLEALAGEWGLVIHEDLVIDQAGIGELFGGSPLTPIINNFDPEHPIGRVMRNVYAIFPMTRSISVTSGANGWTALGLAQTSSGAFATAGFTIVDGKMTLSESAPRTAGPITVAAAASLQIAPLEGESPETEKREGRVVATGTSQFARNVSVGQGGNRDLLLNMLSWLTSDEDLISIRPVTAGSTPIELSDADVIRVLLGLVVGIPLIIIFAGIRTWWVRR